MRQTELIIIFHAMSSSKIIWTVFLANLIMSKYATSRQIHQFMISCLAASFLKYNLTYLTTLYLLGGGGSFKYNSVFAFCNLHNACLNKEI